MPGRGTPMPELYDRIHDHIKRANPGWSDSRVWATTVRAVAKGCATGDVNFPGKQNMNAVSRARYCAAYAQWKKRHPTSSGMGGTGAPGPA
jgi:hypothetical protein